MPVAVEQRARERRSGIDRRESAPAHVRNALQVLQELASHLAGDPEATQKLTAATRRLWLALAEIERLAAAGRARPTVGARARLGPS